MHIKIIKRLLISCSLSLILVCVANSALAVSASPVGTWKTIDDVTGKPLSLVTIHEINHKLQGSITKLLPVAGKPTSNVCEKCTGKRKNMPLLGMVIMWDMQKIGKNHWAYGKVLDPDNGKIYKCKISLGPDGKSLNIRGFIGISLIGRSQTWYRVK